MFLIEAFTPSDPHVDFRESIHGNDLDYGQFSGQKEFTVVTVTEAGSPRRPKGWSPNEMFNTQGI